MAALISSRSADCTLAHDERVGCQGVGTVGTPFRQTRNPCPKALFVVDDEHDGLPLSDLSHPCTCCRRSARKVYPSCPTLWPAQRACLSATKECPNTYPRS